MGFLQDDYWNLKRLFWEGRVQGSGGVIDGVRAEGENRAVEEVKQCHLSINFCLSSSSGCEIQKRNRNLEQRRKSMKIPLRARLSWGRKERA
jgi:hypothetical protein